MVRLGFQLESFSITEINKNTSISFNKNMTGYMKIDIPENKKPILQEILRGFEEYVYAKGYEIRVSIDTSMEDKIFFKFTFDYSNVGDINIDKDINDYIDKIKNGKDFDDFDFIENREIKRIISSLKNRMLFLQNNYELEKDMKNIYMDLLHKVSSMPLLLDKNKGVSIKLEKGIVKMDSKNYSADNSANIMQGDNGSNSIKSGHINIGVTYNDRKKIINKIDNLISMLESNDVMIKKAKRKLESIKDELQDEKEPDESSILKWLKNVKSILDSVKMVEKVYSYANDVYEAFGVKI